MVPWLLLIATLIFAFGNSVAQWMRGLREGPAGIVVAEADIASEAPRIASSAAVVVADQAGAPIHVAPGRLMIVMVIQFIIALYGGFFGGGIGIMMLAGFALLGMREIHAMNALKSVLASVINGVALIVFVLRGAVYWHQALVMVVGAIIGGYAGAALAHHVPSLYVRRFAIGVGLVISAYFFIKQGI
jgi:uncharacterized membrane protein YfcA